MHLDGQVRHGTICHAEYRYATPVGTDAFLIEVASGEVEDGERWVHAFAMVTSAEGKVLGRIEPTKASDVTGMHRLADGRWLMLWSDGFLTVHHPRTLTEQGRRRVHGQAEDARLIITDDGRFGVVALETGRLVGETWATMP